MRAVDVDRRRLRRREEDRTLPDRVANLTRALRTRHSIGLAQGMVMQRYGLDQAGAFRYLARRSQADQTKLYLIADLVVQELTAEGAQTQPGQPDAPAQHL